MSATSLWLSYRIERALGDEDQARMSSAKLKRDFAMSPEMGLLLEAERAQK